MIFPSNACRIFLATQPIDFRKGMDGLAGYIAKMRANVAKVLDVAESVVNIKATTTEKLGFTGRGEGIAAEAVASIVKM